MKILFLDIDGVLNSYRNNKKNYGRPRPFDPEGICALNKILKETGAKIVISSSWRYMYNMESMAELLMLEGLPKDVVIGENPTPSDAEGGYSRSYENWDGTDGIKTRGQECQMWMDYHHETDGEVITHFAAIEDYTDMTGLPPESVFWTNPKTGLTMALAGDIIKYLNREKRQ